jgi:opacity protein-like surface antigen
MRRSLVMICTAAGMLLGWASPVAAQWYVSPFIGKISNITFDQPAASDATALGIAAGTSPRGRFGVELDFTHAGDVFTPEGLVIEDDDVDAIVSSRLRTFTASVQGGYPINVGRVVVRPYGVFGGGLGMYRRSVIEDDFETFFNLPFEQQVQIFDCLDAAPVPTTTSALIALNNQCGNPYLEEDESAYAAMLNVGGGVMVFLTSHLGVRADFRYVTQIVPNEEKLKYFRSVVAIVVH